MKLATSYLKVSMQKHETTDIACLYVAEAYQIGKR